MEFGADVGTIKSAGLPNITGNITSTQTAGTRGVLWGRFDVSGCFTRSNESKSVDNSTIIASDAPRTIGFDASLSSPKYGNSETVQPQSLVLMACIKY